MTRQFQFKTETDIKKSQQRFTIQHTKEDNKFKIDAQIDKYKVQNY